MKALGEQHSLRDVKALGIAGQMHGATLLDSEHRVLRPAIFWNDGRCAKSARCWRNGATSRRSPAT
jgi:xylulokinase